MRFLPLRVFILTALVLTSTFILNPPVQAQQNRAATASSSEMSGTRKQIATIIFSGLAGFTLGLSTLSFYGRPQDKMANLGIGTAIGIIAGTIYTTYQAATAPYDNYQVLRTNFNDEADLRVSVNQTYSPNLKWEWSF